MIRTRCDTAEAKLCRTYPRSLQHNNERRIQAGTRQGLHFSLRFPCESPEEPSNIQEKRPYQSFSSSFALQPEDPSFSLSFFRRLPRAFLRSTEICQIPINTYSADSIHLIPKPLDTDSVFAGHQPRPGMHIEARQYCPLRSATPHSPRATLDRSDSRRGIFHNKKDQYPRNHWPFGG